jgi:hypothetical protein
MCLSALGGIFVLNFASFTLDLLGCDAKYNLSAWFQYVWIYVPSPGGWHSFFLHFLLNMNKITPSPSSGMRDLRIVLSPKKP